MPYREIADDGGAWIAFSTEPRSGANVRPQYADGWLSFHRGVERRRLAPIPSGWETAGDDQLRLWLRASERVARTVDDDEIFGFTMEGSGRPAELGETAADDVEAGDITGSAAPGPGTREPAAPAKRLQKSVERIREMLSGIRGDIT